jgi:hypothetical protein
MADPLTLTALAAVGLTEGIKFLYGQASELLAANRERRRARLAGTAASDTATMPDLTSPDLDRPLPKPIADLTVVDAEEQRLARLAGALSPYALNQLDLPEDEREVRSTAGELRTLLEAIYGQRITFKGERRDATGTRVVIDQRLGEHYGEAVGVDATTIGEGADVEVTQSATRTHPDSRIVGAKVKDIGGRRNPDDEQRDDEP